MKKLLAISLLFISFNCCGAEPVAKSEDPFVAITKYPIFLHLCKKPDITPEIKDYIGTELFGKRWDCRLRETQGIVARTPELYTFPHAAAFNITQTRLLIKAQAEGRKDVEAFVMKHYASKKEIAIAREFIMEK